MATEYPDFDPLRHDRRAADEVGVLKRALDESVKLQSHYATLLNMYDGGSRLTFDSADAWLRRLEELELTKTARAMEQHSTHHAFDSFVEETCNCGRVWRGKPGSNPSKGCPDCGEEMAAEHQWRRENHFP